MRSLEYDIHFFYNNPRIVIGYQLFDSKYSMYILNEIKRYASLYKKFYIISVQETIQSEFLLKNILELIDILTKDGYEIYISMTTTNKNKYYLNPLISLLHYKEFGILGNSADGSDKDGWMSFMDSSLYNNKTKTIKSILSLKNSNNERTLFYNRFDKNFIGTFRYCQYHTEKIPSYTELINEYNSCWSSFVFETQTIESLQSFTDKTIIAMASKTLPILVLVKDNQLKQFEDLGFYFANKDLGYVDDISANTLPKKINRLLDFIKKFNDIDILKIEDMYNNNIDKIQNNKKIINDFMDINFEYKCETKYIKPSVI